MVSGCSFIHCIISSLYILQLVWHFFPLRLYQIIGTRSVHVDSRSEVSQETIWWPMSAITVTIFFIINYSIITAFIIVYNYEIVLRYCKQIMFVFFQETVKFCFVLFPVCFVSIQFSF